MRSENTTPPRKKQKKLYDLCYVFVHQYWPWCIWYVLHAISFFPSFVVSTQCATPEQRSARVGLKDRLSRCAGCTQEALLPFQIHTSCKPSTPVGSLGVVVMDPGLFNQLTYRLVLVHVPARARVLPSMSVCACACMRDVAVVALPESHCTF